MSCWSNYFTHKWVKAGDEANERRKSEKAIKKLRKKCMIEEYGYDYYLRDRTWERIKNQKKNETYENWKRRLSFYGFTVQGFDIKRNEQHYGKPLVRELDFADYSDTVENLGGNTMASTLTLTWDTVLQSFTKDPRDVITRKEGVWFYAYGDGKDVYIEPGRNHENCSKITMRRRLDREHFDQIYDMYRNGTPRATVCAFTQNSSYWFGIFSALMNE